MRKLFFLLSLVSLLLSSETQLNYTDNKLENFTISYVQDKNSSFTIKDIQQMSFTPISNKHAFSGRPGTTWYKLELKNLTKINKEIFLHNNFAYYSKEIDIFEFYCNILVDKTRYNILEDRSSNKLTGSTLIYKLTLPANGKKTIYIKNIPMVSALFDLNIYDKKASDETLIGNSFFHLLIISIMFTLAFYNATLYFFNKRTEFLLYALYLSTPALGLMYKYGIIFSYFQLYGEETYWFNLTAILMPAFLIIFIKQALNTKIMDKKINIILNSLLIIIIFNLISAFIINLTFAMEAFKIMFILTTITLIYLSYYLFKISHPLAIIFSFAYGFYVLGLIITILSMSGIIELNFFTFHSGGIGIIIEALLFSYLMHYNIKILETEIKEQRAVIISKNKKAQLGDMISAITHQWKQPLSRISSITTLMEFKLAKDGKIEQNELEQKLQQINSDIFFLSDTIDDFREFFNPDKTLEESDITQIIQRAISLSKDDTLAKEISIITDLNFENKIFIYKNELLHIILNILQNSKEAFTDSKEKIKIIKIIGYNKGPHLYIDIIDNAGGIKEETLPFIFNEHYTTKENKVGSGLGLYLTKIILEDHLKGSIEAKNIQDGAMFRIIL